MCDLRVINVALYINEFGSQMGGEGFSTMLQFLFAVMKCHIARKLLQTTLWL